MYTKDQLIAAFSNLQTQQPYVVTVAGNIVTIQLNLADAKWYTFFQQNNLKKTFKITITLDEAQHTAVFETEEYELQWEAGIPKVGARLAVQKGEQYTFQAGTGYGIRPDGSAGQVYQYKLNSAELIAEVKSIIKQAGWKQPMSSNTKIGWIAGGIGLLIALLAVGLVVALAASGKLHNSSTGAPMPTMNTYSQP